MFPCGCRGERTAAKVSRATRCGSVDCSATVTQASQPTIKVQTATAFAAGAGVGEHNLRWIQLDKVSRAYVERPNGRWFGALVHAVLAAVDFDAGADEIGAVAHTNARLM